MGMVVSKCSGKIPFFLKNVKIIVDLFTVKKSAMSILQDETPASLLCANQGHGGGWRL